MTNYPAPRCVDLGNPVADVPLNRGLRLWYYGLPNNSGGTRFFDIVPGNRAAAPFDSFLPLVVQSSTLWTVSPFSGSALILNGSSGYAGAAYSTAQAPFTMSSWFWTTSDAMAGQMPMVTINNGSSSDGGWGIITTSTAKLRCAETDGVGGSGEATTSAIIDGGVWNHACAVFRNSTSRSIYLNGQNKKTNTTSVSATASNLNWGRQQKTYGTSFFTGKVADLSIWDRDLSDSEVSALYLEGLAGNPTRLRRYTSAVWSFPVPVTGNRRRRAIICGGGS